MVICFLCNTDHKNNLLNCDIVLTTILKKYKKIKISKYFGELNKISNFSKNSKNKKHKCEFCKRTLSSSANYKKHIASNICKKMSLENKCDHCETIFTSKQSLSYHLTHNVCGLINNKDITNTINPETNIINTNNINTTNNLNNSNNTANNIQNNIQINVNPDSIEMVPFRDVRYKISTKKYLEYANNPDQAIKQFVKDYHLNPEKPERMNVLNTNRRDNRVQLFDFDEDFICRWQTKDKSKVLELLCDRGVNALFFAKTMLAAAGIKLDPNKETALNAKIKEYESSDKVKKRYVDMIGDLTYDYRDMVESNKKKIDTQLKQITES